MRVDRAAVREPDAGLADDLRDATPEPDLDPLPLERLARVPIELDREVGQQTVPGLHQDHSRGADVEIGEVPREDETEQLRQGARVLDARGSSAHDQERLPAPAILRVVLEQRGLEAPQDVVAKGQRVGEILQAERGALHRLQTEEVRGAARREDEPVVLERVPVSGVDSAPVEL
jgi:hypothetical protein